MRKCGFCIKDVMCTHTFLLEQFCHRDTTVYSEHFTVLDFGHVVYDFENIIQGIPVSTQL